MAAAKRRDAEEDRLRARLRSARKREDRAWSAYRAATARRLAISDKLYRHVRDKGDKTT